MRRVATLCLLTTIGFALFPLPRAHASCASPPPLKDVFAEVEVVFLGTVTATVSLDRIATVQVEEVWKGSPLPAVVEVHGGPADENVGTSTDRKFELGVRYLFFPSNGAPPFEDNICSATRPYDPSLERLRNPVEVDKNSANPEQPQQSEEAQEPVASGSVLPFTGGRSLAMWAAVACAVMGAGAGMLRMTHRKRDPASDGRRR